MRSIIIKELTVISLLLGIILSLAGCVKETTVTDPKTVEKKVEEICVDYGTYGAEAKDRIGTLLRELTEIDRSAGKRWSEITEIWMDPDLGKDLNYDELPDGLPDTDELCIVVLGFQLRTTQTSCPLSVDRHTGILGCIIFIAITAVAPAGITV